MSNESTRPDKSRELPLASTKGTPETGSNSDHIQAKTQKTSQTSVKEKKQPSGRRRPTSSMEELPHQRLRASSLNSELHRRMAENTIRVYDETADGFAIPSHQSTKDALANLVQKINESERRDASENGRAMRVMLDEDGKREAMQQDAMRLAEFQRQLVMAAGRPETPPNLFMDPLAQMSMQFNMNPFPMHFAPQPQPPPQAHVSRSCAPAHDMRPRQSGKKSRSTSLTGKNHEFFRSFHYAHPLSFSTEEAQAMMYTYFNYAQPQYQQMQFMMSLEHYNMFPGMPNQIPAGWPETSRPPPPEEPEEHVEATGTAIVVETSRPVILPVHDSLDLPSYTEAMKKSATKANMSTQEKTAAEAPVSSHKSRSYFGISRFLDEEQEEKIAQSTVTVTQEEELKKIEEPKEETKEIEQPKAIEEPKEVEEPKAVEVEAIVEEPKKNEEPVTSNELITIDDSEEDDDIMIIEVEKPSQPVSSVDVIAQQQPVNVASCSPVATEEKICKMGAEIIPNTNGTIVLDAANIGTTATPIQPIPSLQPVSIVDDFSSPQNIMTPELLQFEACMQQRPRAPNREPRRELEELADEDPERSRLFLWARGNRTRSKRGRSDSPSAHKTDAELIEFLRKPLEKAREEEREAARRKMMMDPSTKQRPRNKSVNPPSVQPCPYEDETQRAVNQMIASEPVEQFHMSEDGPGDELSLEEILEHMEAIGAEDDLPMEFIFDTMDLEEMEEYEQDYTTTEQQLGPDQTCRDYIPLDMSLGQAMQEVPIGDIAGQLNIQSRCVNMSSTSQSSISEFAQVADQQMLSTAPPPQIPPVKKRPPKKRKKAENEDEGEEGVAPAAPAAETQKKKRAPPKKKAAAQGAAVVEQQPMEQAQLQMSYQQHDPNRLPSVDNLLPAPSQGYQRNGMMSNYVCAEVSNGVGTATSYDYSGSANLPESSASSSSSSYGSTSGFSMNQHPRQHQSLASMLKPIYHHKSPREQPSISNTSSSRTQQTAESAEYHSAMAYQPETEKMPDYYGQYGCSSTGLSQQSPATAWGPDSVTSQDFARPSSNSIDQFGSFDGSMQYAPQSVESHISYHSQESNAPSTHISSMPSTPISFSNQNVSSYSTQPVSKHNSQMSISQNDGHNPAAEQQFPVDHYPQEYSGSSTNNVQYHESRTDLAQNGPTYGEQQPMNTETEKPMSHSTGEKQIKPVPELERLTPTDISEFFFMNDNPPQSSSEQHPSPSQIGHGSNGVPSAFSPVKKNAPHTPEGDRYRRCQCPEYCIIHGDAHQRRRKSQPSAEVFAAHQRDPLINGQSVRDYLIHNDANHQRQQQRQMYQQGQIHENYIIEYEDRHHGQERVHQQGEQPPQQHGHKTSQHTQQQRQENVQHQMQEYKSPHVHHQAQPNVQEQRQNHLHQPAQQQVLERIPRQDNRHVQQAQEHVQWHGDDQMHQQGQRNVHLSQHQGQQQMHHQAQPQRQENVQHQIQEHSQQQKQHLVRHHVNLQGQQHVEQEKSHHQMHPQGNQQMHQNAQQQVHPQRFEQQQVQQHGQERLHQEQREGQNHVQHPRQNQMHQNGHHHAHQQIQQQGQDQLHPQVRHHAHQQRQEQTQHRGQDEMHGQVQQQGEVQVHPQVRPHSQQQGQEQMPQHVELDVHQQAHQRMQRQMEQHVQQLLLQQDQQPISVEQKHHRKLERRKHRRLQQRLDRRDMPEEQPKPQPEQHPEEHQEQRRTPNGNNLLVSNRNQVSGVRYITNGTTQELRVKPTDTATVQMIDPTGLDLNPKPKNSDEDVPDNTTLGDLLKKSKVAEKIMVTVQEALHDPTKRDTVLDTINCVISTAMSSREPVAKFTAPFEQRPLSLVCRNNRKTNGERLAERARKQQEIMQKAEEQQSAQAMAEKHEMSMHMYQQHLIEHQIMEEREQVQQLERMHQDEMRMQQLIQQQPTHQPQRMERQPMQQEMQHRPIQQQQHLQQKPVQQVPIQQQPMQQQQVRQQQQQEQPMQHQQMQMQKQPMKNQPIKKQRQTHNKPMPTQPETQCSQMQKQQMHEQLKQSLQKHHQMLREQDQIQQQQLQRQQMQRQQKMQQPLIGQHLRQQLQKINQQSKQQQHPMHQQQMQPQQMHQHPRQPGHQQRMQFSRRPSQEQMMERSEVSPQNQQLQEQKQLVERQQHQVQYQQEPQGHMPPHQQFQPQMQPEEIPCHPDHQVQQHHQPSDMQQVQPQQQMIQQQEMLSQEHLLLRQQQNEELEHTKLVHKRLLMLQDKRQQVLERAVDSNDNMMERHRREFSIYNRRNVLIKRFEEETATLQAAQQSSGSSAIQRKLLERTTDSRSSINPHTVMELQRMHSQHERAVAMAAPRRPSPRKRRATQTEEEMIQEQIQANRLLQTLKMEQVPIPLQNPYVDQGQPNGKKVKLQNGTAFVRRASLPIREGELHHFSPEKQNQQAQQNQQSMDRLRTLHEMDRQVQLNPVSYQQPGTSNMPSASQPVNVTKARPMAKPSRYKKKPAKSEKYDPNEYAVTLPPRPVTAAGALMIPTENSTASPSNGSTLKRCDSLPRMHIDCSMPKKAPKKKVIRQGLKHPCTVAPIIQTLIDLGPLKPEEVIEQMSDDDDDDFIANYMKFSHSVNLRMEKLPCPAEVCVDDVLTHPFLEDALHGRLRKRLAAVREGRTTITTCKSKKKKTPEELTAAQLAKQQKKALLSQIVASAESEELSQAGENSSSSTDAQSQPMSVITNTNTTSIDPMSGAQSPLDSHNLAMNVQHQEYMQPLGVDMNYEPIPSAAGPTSSTSTYSDMLDVQHTYSLSCENIIPLPLNILEGEDSFEEAPLAEPINGEFRRDAPLDDTHINDPDPMLSSVAVPRDLSFDLLDDLEPTQRDDPFLGGPIRHRPTGFFDLDEEFDVNNHVINLNNVSNTRASTPSAGILDDHQFGTMEASFHAMLATPPASPMRLNDEYNYHTNPVRSASVEMVPQQHQEHSVRLSQEIRPVNLYRASAHLVGSPGEQLTVNEIVAIVNPKTPRKRPGPIHRVQKNPKNTRTNYKDIVKSTSATLSDDQVHQLRYKSRTKSGSESRSADISANESFLMAFQEQEQEQYYVSADSFLVDGESPDDVEYVEMTEEEFAALERVDEQVVFEMNPAPAQEVVEPVEDRPQSKRWQWPGSSGYQEMLNKPKCKRRR